MFVSPAITFLVPLALTIYEITPPAAIALSTYCFVVASSGSVGTPRFVIFYVFRFRFPVGAPMLFNTTLLL